MIDDVLEPLSTKEQLLATAVRLLDAYPPEEITSEQILLESGFSKGSLYHHYRDFSDLMETAQVQLFASYVAETLEELIDYLNKTSDPNLVREAFYKLAQAQKFTDSLEFRLTRLRITYSAASNERMRTKLAPVQEELTQKWMTISEICQKRGWAKTKLDSRSVSVMLQSTIIGRVLDDNASNHIDVSEWIRALEFIFDTFFFNKLDDFTRIAKSDETELRLIVISGEDPKCKELEDKGYEVVSDVRNSSLHLSPMSDLATLNESYLKALYKMYRIEIIGSEFAQRVVEFRVANSDFPSYLNTPGDDFPDLNGLPELWDVDSTLYGAFYRSEMVGFLRVQNAGSGVELRTCNIHRQHRSQGLASALVAYAILSKQNKGVINFISKNDNLIPARLEIMTRLGFQASPSTLTYARKSQG